MPRRSLLALLAAVALAAPAASAQPAADDPAPRRHQAELLGLFVSPTGEPIDDVYGSHSGVAARYTFLLRPRWELAVEVGTRQADGTTVGFPVPAELEVLHAAALASRRWGPGVERADRWSVSAGAGVVLLDVEETLSFEGPVTATDTLAGALVRAGGRWPVSSSWGLSAEGRFTVMQDAEAPGPNIEPADFGAFELAAGVFVAF